MKDSVSSLFVLLNKVSIVRSVVDPSTTGGPINNMEIFRIEDGERDDGGDDECDDFLHCRSFFGFTHLALMCGR